MTSLDGLTNTIDVSERSLVLSRKLPCLGVMVAKDLF